MKATELNMSMQNKSIKINDIEIDLLDLDMYALTKD
jgi:hypothetical protein